MLSSYPDIRGTKIGRFRSKCEVGGITPRAIASNWLFQKWRGAFVERSRDAAQGPLQAESACWLYFKLSLVHAIALRLLLHPTRYCLSIPNLQFREIQPRRQIPHSHLFTFIIWYFHYFPTHRIKKD